MKATLITTDYNEQKNTMPLLCVIEGTALSLLIIIKEKHTSLQYRMWVCAVQFSQWEHYKSYFSFNMKIKKMCLCFLTLLVLTGSGKFMKPWSEDKDCN